MALSSSYHKPLHKALLTSDFISLEKLSNKHSLDLHTMVKTRYVLNDYSNRGCNITPLQASVITGNYRVCKRLLTEGAQLVSLAQHMTLDPLNMALDINRFQIAKLLITYGANVCVAQFGRYPMYFAIKTETPEYIVEAIINAGFPPNGVVETIWHSTSLHRAVAYNNIPVVKLLMKYDVNCNEIDSSQGNTAMHIAVKQRLPQMVKLLAEYGVNLEIECKEGCTPLFHALMNNDVEILELLLQFGSELHHLSNVKLVYPLNFAAYLCKEKVTEVLLKHGTNVRLVTPTTGNSALHSAVLSKQGQMCEENHRNLENIVQCLIENGSDINLRNNNGYSAIQLAIKEENFKIVELLVKKGSAVNGLLDQGTNFHFVSKLGTKELVHTFLEYGADYSAFCENGLTPYHMAVFNPDKTVFQVFWKFYCPFDQSLQDPSRKLFYGPDIADLLEKQIMFMSGIKTNNVAIMYDAMTKGAQVKCCSVEVPYPLHLASMNGFTSVVHLMLDNGVQPNYCNNKGETPLHLAATHGHYHVCLYLLMYGASYNALSKSSGKTPLQYALQNNHFEVVGFLKEIDQLFKSYNEAFIIKKLEKYQNKPYCLLVLINSVNKKGETLMAMALRKGYKAVANRIIKFRCEQNED